MKKKVTSIKRKGKRADPADIVQLILKDHKPLKARIKIMKDPDKHSLSQRQKAFKEFAPLLTAHAKSEEKSLYVAMKDEEELRVESFEGDTEHTIADSLVKEIKGIDEEDEWTAKVKVLAELVEHHIEEEEEEMLVEVKKEMETETRLAIGQEYLRLYESYSEAEGVAPEEWHQSLMAG